LQIPNFTTALQKTVNITRQEKEQASTIRLAQDKPAKLLSPVELLWDPAYTGIS